MSLSPQFRRHIYPALGRLGFERYDIWWRLRNDENWLTQVEVKSSSFGDDGLYHVECDIGFFSRELDELMGWGRQSGFDESTSYTMPNSMAACHWYSSIFNLDNQGVWIGQQENVFLPKGKSCEGDVAKIASKLERVIPEAFKRYASYENLLTCKEMKTGQLWQSKQASMYAAAACIKLKRFEEAGSFLEEAVRPGSIQFMKDIGARMTNLIEALR